MHRLLPVALLGVVPALALSLMPTANAGQGRQAGHDLIRAELTPSVPTDQPIDGVAPGALPWIIDRGEVRVRPDGRMDVRITGLQVPRNGGADNPVGMIDAVLYCEGHPVADSGPQPMSVPEGDARFRVRLDVPSTCDDAAVLISPSPLVGRAYIASAVAV
jgi:hypothetical protein